MPRASPARRRGTGAATFGARRGVGCRRDTGAKAAHRQDAALPHAYAFLGLDDFQRITRWKLGRQLKRVPQLEQLTESLVRSVTRAAFHLHADHEPSDAIATSVCLGVLTSLPGVGVPVATAVLALTFPDDYCVVDFRGWRALFGEDRRDGFGRTRLPGLPGVRKLSSAAS